MIDIHTHVLPGLDDGPQTIDESLAMLRQAAQAGTTDVAATPHLNNDYSPDADLIEERIQELQAACGPSPRLHYGCDWHLTFENVTALLDQPRRYTLNHGRYLLVELPHWVAPEGLTPVLERLLSVGITPVITHPERHAILRARIDLLQCWVHSGCALQLTAQSLFGHFGRVAKRASWELLSRGLVAAIASDAHDLERRPPDLSQAWRAVESRYGREWAELWMITNPGRMLRDADLSQPAARPRRRWWF